MIRDIKLGYQLMKHGLNFYKMIYGGLIILALAMISELFTIGGGLSTLVIGIFPMLMVQLMYSISLSTMVQSSPYKKRLQTTVPAIYVTLSMIVVNTYCVLSQLINYQEIERWGGGGLVTYIYESGEYETSFVLTSVVLVVFMLFGALGAKNFGLSVVFIYGICGLAGKIILKQGISYVEMPVNVAILLSYVVALLGCVLFYIIACITYKKNHSKITFDSLLKRAS